MAKKAILGCPTGECLDGSKDIILTVDVVASSSSIHEVQSAVGYLSGYAPADLWTRRSDHNQRPALFLASDDLTRVKLLKWIQRSNYIYMKDFE